MKIVCASIDNDLCDSRFRISVALSAPSWTVAPVKHWVTAELVLIVLMIESLVIRVVNWQGCSPVGLELHALEKECHCSLDLRSWRWLRLHDHDAQRQPRNASHYSTTHYPLITLGPTSVNLSRHSSPSSLSDHTACSGVPVPARMSDRISVWISWQKWTFYPVFSIIFTIQSLNFGRFYLYLLTG